ALLQNTTVTGKPLASLLLLEVDEATVPRISGQLKTRMAVITNFFRDQLDRYGEVDTTVKLVKEALSPDTELILNADDPLVAQFGWNREKVYSYGVECLPVSSVESLETREGKYCPFCGRELNYTLFHYGQLGIYNCPGCEFERPELQMCAKDVRQDSAGLNFRVEITENQALGTTEVVGETQENMCEDNAKSWDCSIPIQGFYNLYNALAAFAAAERLGISREVIRQGLKNYVSDAGRMEKFSLPEGQITLTLVKNPTGFNQVIHTIVAAPQKIVVLIAINDLAADGRDISWLWDVDFEILNACSDRIYRIVCSGLRAEDMALRLKYAGLDEKIILIENNLEEAVKLLQNVMAGENKVVYILPTYTALFPIREILDNKQTAILQTRAVS
ncbi:MAG: MurT ligase domain-containing protein, partial [Eubacteriales bacterium]